MAKRIVIFASGSGSNAENLIRFFRLEENKSVGTVVAILCNNPAAGVIDRAKSLQVPCVIFSKEDWNNPSLLINIIRQYSPDLTVLAGFLKKFPEAIINELQGKVINLHPALLPNYGGKGMFGMHVHEAVIAQQEPKSGITIHWVNEHYDDGAIIAQFECDIDSTDTPKDLAEKIHGLEFQYFPAVVKDVLNALS